MADHDVWADLRDAVAAAEEAAGRLEARLERARHRLRCVECGIVDDGRRGWTLRLDVDGDLAAFCPDCDEEEFG